MEKICENIQEQISELIEGQLTAENKLAIERHISQCPACAVYLRQLQADDKLLNDFADAMRPVLSRLEKKVIDSIKFTPAEKQLTLTLIWRTIMKSKITKLAAAAIIIIAVVIGVHHFGGSIDMTSVAWSQVAERVGNIKTCIFRGHSKISGGKLGDKVQEMEQEMYVSSEYGYRADTYVDGNISMMQYTIPSQKVMLSLIPQGKQYIKMRLTDEQLMKMRLQGSDPREMFKLYTSGKYTELGRSVIDGVEVEGIETTDPKVFGGQFENCTWRAWVDIVNQFPVRIEMEMQMPVQDSNDGSPTNMLMVMDNFQWGVEIAPETFEPNIPPDYKLMAEMQMPGNDEGSAVKGLQVYAEITGGKYPRRLATMDIMKDVMKAIGAKNRSNRNDPNNKLTKEEKEQLMEQTMKKAMEKYSVVMGACTFYAELVKTDKDAAYYGDRVTANEPNAVLLRWKISDGQYRVMYGNLTAENVSVEKLTELEAQLPK